MKILRTKTFAQSEEAKKPKATSTPKPKNENVIYILDNEGNKVGEAVFKDGKIPENLKGNYMSKKDYMDLSRESFKEFKKQELKRRGILEPGLKDKAISFAKENKKGLMIGGGIVAAGSIGGATYKKYKEDKRKEKFIPR